MLASSAAVARRRIPASVRTQAVRAQSTQVGNTDGPIAEDGRHGRKQPRRSETVEQVTQMVLQAEIKHDVLAVLETDVASVNLGSQPLNKARKPLASRQRHHSSVSLTKSEELIRPGVWRRARVDGSAE